MRPAANAREFVRAPVGRYVAGRTWIACCPAPQLAGFVLWGKPDQHDARSFLEVLPPRGTEFAEKRARFVDMRLLEAPEPSAFAVFSSRVEEDGADLSEIVSRAAVIHGRGLSGAVAEGFRNVVSTPFPMALFTEPRPAFEWLDAGDPDALFDELAEIRERTSREAPLVRDLRLVLGADVRGVTLASAAAALGLSTRSLQRRLAEHGASFQGELARTRVERAQRILLDTRSSVADVAREVGCASAHHFTLIFRKATGRTPARWREERKSRP